MKRGVKKQSGSTGSIRVISGKWRGRKLPVLDAVGLRPTTDRNKETLFNWLMSDVQSSKCLDMFSGSGGLGIECLSRYADSVTFIEKDKMAFETIRRNLETLNVGAEHARLHKGNALEVARTLNCVFDIVFVDPPFNQQLVPKSIEIIAKMNLVKSGSKVYIECERQNQDYAIPSDWQLSKEKQTQNVSSRLYTVV